MKKEAGMAVALALAVVAAAHGEPRVVERIVAVVDGRPVLHSEVEAARRVTGDAAGPAREALIDELLMFAEASRLPQAVLGPGEESAALEGLAARAVGFTDEEALRRMARRQATILKYVELRFRPQVRVTDEAEDLDRRIEAWVAELRQAARIRYNVNGSGPSSR